MRLESCILLERLGLLTGMTDENGPGPEIRARALALMNQATSLLDDHEGGLCRPPVRPKARFLMKRITWMMKVLEAQKTGLLPLRNGPFVPRGIARLKTMLRVMERGTTMPTLIWATVLLQLHRPRSSSIAMSPHLRTSLIETETK
ncbi:hypothetical protein CIHG_09397 [Coccidioides immitis H538.4]|uniref:Uncharacterized protein n=1 Tax=Coccidioides immitis H538.4 TaxID=396776 RepID=A0A0J8S2P0_COCIT|nr:hypothetical protein CIHG_09397 [Coccidioides immitis H538.4]